MPQLGLNTRQAVARNVQDHHVVRAKRRLRRCLQCRRQHRRLAWQQGRQHGAKVLLPIDNERAFAEAEGQETDVRETRLQFGQRWIDFVHRKADVGVPVTLDDIDRCLVRRRPIGFRQRRCIGSRAVGE